MRALVVLFLVVLAIALVSSRRQKLKRFRCKSDSDCKDNQCCVKTRVFSFCSRKLKEGSVCGFTKYRCGCAEDLVCKKSRYFIKRCTKEEGSGDDDDFTF